MRKKHMSMLEDYWLPRREGGKADQLLMVENLGEMEDVEYFLKKLYKALFDLEWKQKMGSTWAGLLIPVMN